MAQDVEGFRAADERHGRGAGPASQGMAMGRLEGASPRAAAAALLRSWGLPERMIDGGPRPGLPEQGDAPHRRRAAGADLDPKRLEAELLAALDYLADMAMRLREAENRVRELSAENEVLRERAATAHQDQDTRAFWDRVLWSVCELLERTGPLSPIEILARLPADLRRDAALPAEPLNTQTLRKTLIGRGAHRDIEAAPDGRWRRRAGGRA